MNAPPTPDKKFTALEVVDDKEKRPARKVDAATFFALLVAVAASNHESGETVGTLKRQFGK